MPVNGVRVRFGHVAQLLNRRDVVVGKLPVPGQVVPIICEVGRHGLGEPSPEAGRIARSSWLDAEVGGVVVEEDAEEPGAVWSLAAADDGGVERDQAVGALVHEIQETRTVGPGVLAGQVADEVAVDKNLDGVGVEPIVGLRQQHGGNVVAHPVATTGTDDLPERLLVVGLTDDL